jgi:hypothetical protein
LLLELRCASCGVAWALVLSGAAIASAQTPGDAGTELPTPASELKLSLVPAPSAEPAPQAAQAATATKKAEPYELSATGRVEKARPNQQHVESEVMRELPGALGDPFRVLESLPGVVPVFNGLPYVYVRGAPPAGTVYYYDDIQVPALFHLALGPAVVHPAMIGNIDFYPSVAPARYGRYTGGVLVGGRGESPPPSSVQGEAELRLIDANGMVETPLGKGGSLTIAGRYGYPGLLLSALSPDVVLAYWDYQLRLELPLDATDRLEVTWFGSYDHAGQKKPDAAGNAVTLEFHRAEARLIHKVGRLELGSMLQAGYERSAIQQQAEVTAARMGPRLYVAWHDDAGVRVRVGGDFFGAVGKLHNSDNPQEPGTELINPRYAAVAARSVSGLYGELHVPIVARLALDAGLRGDVWLTGSRAQEALEPRTTLTFHSDEQVAWHAAVGLGHQPAVFLLPLPGLTDVALDRGLQSAIQSEAGVAIDFPESLRLESQFYLQRFSNMILPDAVFSNEATCAGLPFTADGTFGCSVNQFPRSSAWAYGLEVFLRRATAKALSGWISYTLGWAEARSEQGVAFTPSFDVRHLLNLVLQYRLGGGFSAGGRLHYQSGKVASHTFVRDRPILYEQRLPGFFRADAELAYAWATHWGRLRLALEWLNLSMSREATNIDCHDGVQTGKNPLSATPCLVRFAPPIFFPDLGLRAQF